MPELCAKDCLKHLPFQLKLLGILFTHLTALAASFHEVGAMITVPAHQFYAILASAIAIRYKFMPSREGIGIDLYGIEAVLPLRHETTSVHLPLDFYAGIFVAREKQEK